uniref:Phosphate transporter n=1 Tax=Populus alba TaxID=43335 RepID=A0A4U5MAX3_POPAL|nr:inorganic phosphate transporter 2-1, chloroplastic [Populus alba]
MTLFYTLSSSTRNIISPETHVLHNSHFYLPRNRSSFFSNETTLFKRETLPFKPQQQQQTGSFPPILRLNNSKLAHPFASISSYAESGGEEEKNEGVQIEEHQETVKKKENDSPGMAQAFDISSRTASAISILIAFAALSLPLFMKTLGQGLDLKTKFLSYVTLLFGFYMAWNIGGVNCSCFGVLRSAVDGYPCDRTMQKGILVANVFQGKDTLLFAGLLSSLAAAGTWLQVASYYGWPVSTTHCIVGSMVGFGLVYGGPGAVFWSSLARVISSWVISPLMEQWFHFLYTNSSAGAPNPGLAAAAAAPIAVFLGVTGISFAAFPLSKVFPVALAQALASGAVGAFLVYRIIPETAWSSPGPKGTQLEIVYGVFGYMQILSACFMSFAHGGNDVSNAIGPLAAALSILHGGASGTEIVIPMDVLAWGGFGIVAGLMMWGYRVIATIGKKITELTPTRGFAAEFAAASVVLVASKLGLPISATHTLVGAVMGVGFARGLNSVRAETVREIVVSWAVTIPVGAIFAVLYTWILTKLLSYIL